MRITIPIDVWNPRRGGLEHYLSLFAEALQQRGHDVKVLCLKAEVEEDGRSNAASPCLEVLSVPRHPRWLREVLFARRCRQRHREEKRDLLFAVRHALEADVYQPHGGCYRRASAAALECLPWPLGLLKRGARLLRPTHAVLCWLDRAVFVQSQNLMTLSLSKLVEDDFSETYPDIEMRFHRIPGGVPLEQFHDRDRLAQTGRLRQQFGSGDSCRTALFVAQKFRPKGLAHAIAACALVDDWHLVVAGGDRQGPSRRLAHRLGVADRVHFAGRVGDARELYAGSDVCILPTYYDSCSLTILEALACGTPVVTTRRNGSSELVPEGEAGFILSHPGAERDLADALAKIGADWPKYHRGALAVRAELSWKDHVARVIDAIEQYEVARGAPA